MLAGAEYRSGKRYPKLAGICPICDAETVLVVDHCHQHGLIRGRICASCNVRLGFIEKRELATGYATMGSYGPEVVKQLGLCPECRPLMGELIMGSFGSDEWLENQHSDGWNDLYVIDEPEDYEDYPARNASPALREKVGTRDGWICHRCQQPISRDRKWPHPLSAVADHFPVTLDNGGPTTLDNLRIAHSLCNNPTVNDGLSSRLYADPSQARYPYTDAEIAVMDHIRAIRNP